MKECHDNYDFAVFEISQAFDLFDKGLYGDASRKVGYANEAAFLCRKVACHNLPKEIIRLKNSLTT